MRLYTNEAMTENLAYYPRHGYTETHRARQDGCCRVSFRETVFGAKVVLERDPVVMKLANSWLILNVGGGPTDDKPTVTLTTPGDPGRASAFLNIRVADIGAVYAEWSARSGRRGAPSSSPSRRITAARSVPTFATLMGI